MNNDLINKLIIKYIKIKKKDNINNFDYMIKLNNVLNDLNNELNNEENNFNYYIKEEFYNHEQFNNIINKEYSDLLTLNNEENFENEEILNLIKSLNINDLLYIFNKSSYDLEIILSYFLYNNKFNFNDLFLIYILIEFKLLNHFNENKNILLIIKNKINNKLKEFIND